MMKPSLVFGLTARALMIAATAMLPFSAAQADAADPHDLTGAWRNAGMSLFLGIDLPYTPQGQNLMADRIDLVKAGHSMASPHLTCRPTGTAAAIGPKSPILIMQTPQKISVITQEDREVRFIHLDRGHPEKVAPTYSGDSVAHWEGPTLVIDTIGYNGRGQIDEIGNPQSDKAHVVERWTKGEDGKSLKIEYTITDPVYFTKPFTVTRTFLQAPGTRIRDYDCSENPRADDFDNLTFPDDFFKPTCTRPIVNGVSAEKVVCVPPKTMPSP
ncbi:hypothetical protein WSK_2875 [Novosphingobium sp. Rr 2-17]|uniref:hypothetical protein n=1 Tax=Novosphingobium sp. Rr 2-17 TaxID=555793 RepID=UPI0002699EDF|nr:hypothetical protein [Novosphingobium sp. Rr 2-17]EIZ78827.1 hypothetical protein WSK_2875 [Novosphingobium sp. Rr 2-17]